MPVSANTNSNAHVAARSGLLALLMFAVVSVAHAAGFFVLSAKSELVNNVYRLTASIKYQFSSDVVDALKNGIPVVLKLDIEVLEPQAWYFWSETVATLQQRYRVQYQALSQRYLVSNINSATQEYFSSLDEAIASLDHVDDLPILDKSLLDPDRQYALRMRADIDFDALPVPLRYYAYVLPEWLLGSDWYSFPLS